MAQLYGIRIRNVHNRVIALVWFDLEGMAIKSVFGIERIRSKAVINLGTPVGTFKNRGV